MASDADKREFTRVEVHVEVEAAAGPQRIVSGRVRNVSLNGVFMVCAEKLPAGEPCSVALILAGRDEPLRIEADGRVARIDDDGVAIEFTQVAPDDLGHLRNLVLYNAGQPDEVEEEFARHFGLKQP